MKFVSAITDKAIITTLQHAWRLGSTPYLRERAHAILLSHRGYSLEQIADVFGTQYQTISSWIDHWEDYGIRGLYKSHGGGVTAREIHEDPQPASTWER
ncbi:helix-turn-helix domain-containing protein [Endozoicomonas sp. YOMI1]|uniref:helix-turn-helix domain-containing protein n=1 Tax=Endozoicomonas sp. YOMI1 TaxID=2828739 RepID=UPI002148A69B|nr:helix-turn-helix domain-containing protein [Endozoicomonas sp. YOMI1]